MVECVSCGKSNAPSGEAPNKYCKSRQCQDIGILAGHIRDPHAADKRQRINSPAGSAASSEEARSTWSTAVGRLTEIYSISGCRRKIPNIPHSARRLHSSLSVHCVLRRLSMRCRHCSFESNDIVGRQNGPDESNPMEEYLVYGHFDERDERDKKGHDTTIWMALETLTEHMRADAAALDAALAAWEQLSVDRRSQRMRELREQLGDR